MSRLYETLFTACGESNMRNRPVHLVKPHWLAILALIANFWFIPLSSAAPKLNGVGAISLSNKWQEMFIAGVYSDNFTISSRELLNMPGEKRMEIRFTLDEIDTGEFIHIWKQRLATNSGVEVFESNNDHLKQMQKIIGEKLIKNDILVFEKLSGTGTKIFLNGSDMGQINEPDFFDFLLLSWVGRQPPSIEFRARLLQAGNIDEELLARYEAIIPSAERIAAIKTSRETAKTVAKATNKKADTAVKKTAKSVVAKTAKTATQEASKKVISQANAKVKSATTAAKVVSKVASIPSSSKPKQKQASTGNKRNINADAQANNQIAPSKKPKATEKPKIAKVTKPKPQLKTATKPLKISRPQTSEALVFNKEQAYLSEVQNWVLLHVDYPLLAQQEKREDTVTIAVTIGRSGQLIETSLLNPSKHLELTAAAVAAVNQAEPFPAIPNHLKYDRLTLNIPIEFSLNQ